MKKMLQNKKILLGITGGIASYKCCELIRLLQSQGADVRVVMTPAAAQFVQPLTFRTLSCNTIYNEMFDQTLDVDLEHISLARWADIFLIAPATANTLAKLAHGIADNLLTSVVLATTSPLLVAPAMNQAMWLNPATQENMAILERRGVKVLGPGEGEQACGDLGPGRMLEPEEIVELLSKMFSSSALQKKKS